MADNSPIYTPGMVIIKFATQDMKEISTCLKEVNAYTWEQAFPNLPPSNSLSAVYKLRISSGTDIRSLIYKLQNKAIIEYAQPNYINHLCAEPNDQFYTKQWALQAIQVLQAWKIEKGKSDIVVAIVDTGVEYEHEDLESRIWINPGEIDGNGLDDDGNGYVDDIRGWDFTDTPEFPLGTDYLDRDNNPDDETGHGTHVAGIVGAIPDNTEGVAGVTWNCRIMAVRGGGKILEDDDLAAAIIYAADNGAHIINMSWGSDVLSFIIRDAIEYAYSKGCILVAAVGNDDRSNVIYPALHNHVISVGATNDKDEKASFSNYGPGVDIVAPGESIFSTVRGDRYSNWKGTSMASPIVSGVVALMLSRRPGLSGEEVAQILRSSADEIDEPLFAGAGRVNSAKALAASSDLVASISSPENGSGMDQGAVITGTASGYGFSKYQLEYTHIPNIYSFDGSEEFVWNEAADFQTNPRLDAPLGKINTALLEEGIYLVRLKVYGYNNAEPEDKIIIQVDHTPPEIVNLRSVSRLDGDRYRYAVTWQTKDLTLGEVHYRSHGIDLAFQRLDLLSYVNEHTLYLSDVVSPGQYEYFIESRNKAGLLARDDNEGNYYQIEIKALSVRLDGFEQTDFSIPATHLVTTMADFDEDGLEEIVGMKSTKFRYEPVYIYERDSSGTYQEVFESDNDYLAWDVGDTDGDELYEILGSRDDVTSLYESPQTGEYPVEKIWSMKGLWGGQIADTDQDGKMEMLLMHLEADEIHIYENRKNNSYIKTERLFNPTEGRNHLSSTFAVSDFDGDGLVEIAIGDSDGDLFVYENAYNDGYTHTWTGNLSASDLQYMASGDFDGDGKDEFVVGGRVSGLATQVKDSLNSSAEHTTTGDFDDDGQNESLMGAYSANTSAAARQRWVYAVFGCPGQDEYSMIWNQEIMGLRSESSVSVGDVDGDGRDEILVIVTPGIYIFNYTEDEGYRAEWYHSAEESYWPMVADLDADGIMEITFNEEDELISFKPINAVSDFRPIWGLSAIPLGETEVELHWNGPPDAASYTIYRGISKSKLEEIDTILSENNSTEIYVGYFHDKNLKKDVTYWYAITWSDRSGEVKKLSEEIFVTPNAPPALLSAEYLYPLNIQVLFNEPMGYLAQNEAAYTIASNSGITLKASSAILSHQGLRVTLTLATNAGLPSGKYTVTARKVQDTSGVIISEINNSAEFLVQAQETQIWQNLSQIKVYPNPVLPSSQHPGKITFDRLPPKTNISIYDCYGQVVRHLGEDSLVNGKIIWYLDNDVFQKVSSGVYTYIAESRNDRRTGKIAVVR